jgi:ribosomal protein S12 methylthiotransferase
MEARGRAVTAFPMKIGFVSLGCPKNLVDSEVMMGLLVQRGHELTYHAAEADVLVVNTCSFIQPAQQESVNAILEMAGHKKSGQARKLIVAGCLVERYRDEIRREIPEVDAVIGANEIERIIDVCENAGSPRAAPASERAPYLYHDLTPRVRATSRHLAYIKIAEGCDHPCSFCVIPQFRGRFRSRRWESVVAEARNLFDQGVREITLIGQDTTCFGEDYGLKDGLAFLLDRLARLENAGWIRVLYVYPNKVTQKLLDTMAAHETLCKYIDVPFQHASASVLKRMKRGGSGDVFLRLIERIRKTIPGVALRTSMIVGFPGESEADFRQLCDFLAAAQFDHLGVFAYSDEETSASYHLDGKIDARTIYNRKRRLMAVQRRISRAKKRSLVGQTLPILIDGPSPETDLLWEGRLAGQAAEIDGKTYLNDFEGGCPEPGTFGWVRITESRDYDLIGTLLASSREYTPAARRSGPGEEPFRILQ